MGLKSFFSRRRAAPDSPPAATPRPRARATQGDTGDAVQQARLRARQRLTGAVVLLSIGVIGFPLLFETQPRPIPVDIPITIPNKDNVAPLAAPEPARLASGAVAEAASPPVIEERAADAGRELPSPAAAASSPGPAPAAGLMSPAPAPAVPSSAAKADKTQKAEKDRRKATAEPARPGEAVPAGDAAQPAAVDADAARAKALLDGQAAASSPTSGRFVVQVGAFADAGSAHLARLKVEKLGLKTYTQVVETPGGKRIRVRVGPFASRDDASQAAGKLHAAGLPSAVLTL